MNTRRNFLAGLTGFVACTPAIVRASSLMPVKALRGDLNEQSIVDLLNRVHGYRFVHEFTSMQVGLGYAFTRQALLDNLPEFRPQWPEVFAALPPTRAA